MVQLLGDDMSEISITLEISPSFSGELRIELSEGFLSSKGNIDLENICCFSDAQLKLELTAVNYDYLLGNIREITIPAIPDFSIGLDGTTYKITFSNGFNLASYTWWGECPKEWNELGNLANRLISYVRSAYPVNSE